MSCDTDQDGFGNVCDGDSNQDLAVDGSGFANCFRVDLIAGVDGGTGADMNCDTVVDGADFTIFRGIFPGAGAPGPSGPACAGPRVNGCPNP
jgi:hypothetical protein